VDIRAADGWRFLVYILKAFRVLVNVTEQTVSLGVITGHVSRRGRGADISYTL
jgi:hypothetical protein